MPQTPFESAGRLRHHSGPVSLLQMVERGGAVLEELQAGLCLSPAECWGCQCSGLQRGALRDPQALLFSPVPQRSMRSEDSLPPRVPEGIPAISSEPTCPLSGAGPALAAVKRGPARASLGPAVQRVSWGCRDTCSQAGGLEQKLIRRPEVQNQGACRDPFPPEGPR